MAPRLFIRSIDWFERPVAFRIPFRFGAVTVTEASQLFLFAEIETQDGGRGLGATAELMVPKWFNKDPALTPDQTVDQLRRALQIARDRYLERPALDAAFGHHAAHHDASLAACAREGIPALAAAFGPAQIDKAVLDALLRAHDRDVFSGLRDNIVGLDARLTPDLDEHTLAHYLKSREPLSRIMVRHTVGMTDPVADLPAIHARTGCRYFKLKLSGDVAADSERLARIAAELKAAGIDYRATLDANEQYGGLDTLTDLGEALRTPGFADFLDRLLYIEQPLPRDLTFGTPLGAFGERFAVIVDEGEGGYDSFPDAVALGYRGISSKACKGLYKSLVNGARAARWTAEGAPRFLAGEDLTCQAGLAVQQDLALLAFHGIVHSERNGHHFVGGFPGTPTEEIDAFRRAHPDLYEQGDGGIRLAIRDGSLATGSLAQAGFASGVDPALIRHSAMAL